jgi:hypothetical protein
MHEFSVFIIMFVCQFLRNYGLSIASDSSVSVVLYSEVSFISHCDLVSF